MVLLLVVPSSEPNRSKKGHNRIEWKVMTRPKEHYGGLVDVYEFGT